MHNTQHPARAGAPPFILVVDDDAVMAEVARALLERAGWRVVCELEPAAALMRLARSPTPPRLLLTDHDMPGLNGIELVRLARSLHPGLPVVLVSGHVGAALVAAARAAGVLLLPKAAFHESLVATVLQALAARDPP